jgi:hypothetical protein
MDMLLDMVNQNIQETLKKCQDIKNEEHKKTQKQINELIWAHLFTNKHQSKTENTINREINKINDENRQY